MVQLVGQGLEALAVFRGRVKGPFQIGDTGVEIGPRHEVSRSVD
jgi:hypothetical protein